MLYYIFLPFYIRNYSDFDDKPALSFNDSKKSRIIL